MTIAQEDSIEKTPPSILFFSSNTALDTKILAHNPLVTWHIILPLSTRAQSFIKTFFSLFFSFIHSFFYLCKHRPKKIITTGGIIAIPTCIAGFLLRIPIIVYSLDAVPGKAIKALTPLASSIVTCFASTQQYFPAHKCSVASYPIKYQKNDTLINQHHAQKKLGLSFNKKTIVILGGSQGSLFLNQCMKHMITNPLFSTNTLQIIHQTGENDSTDWKTFYKTHNITTHVFTYHPDLSQIYAAADLIICRAGAGTLFEIKFFNKRCIIIPLKTATTSHQIDNAHAMVNECPELFCTIAQSDIEINSTLLFTHIYDILNSL